MTIRVIIADDHQLFIDGIKSILNQEIGIEIIAEANNGHELIKHLDNNVIPDVILTDIRMPVIDGITATKAISKKYPNIPILALSMYNQESDAIEMIDAGAKGYIVKNAGKLEMLEAIYALHNRKSYFSKEIHDKIKDYEKKVDSNKTLTKREKQILQLIARGRTSMAISQELNISKLTVDTHRKNIHKKLHIDTNAGLIKFALKYHSFD